MKHSAIYIIIIAISFSACSGLNRTAENTSSAKAAYGMPDMAPPPAKTGKTKTRKPKIKETKSKKITRSSRSGWTGG